MHEHDACGVGFVVNMKGVQSHAIIEQGLQILANLTHRGACGCDPLTGDGAGILARCPTRSCARRARRSTSRLPPAGEYGVGMVFLPERVDERNECLEMFEKVVREEGQRLLGWRRVPVDATKCGPLARESMPEIRQIFIARGRSTPDTAALERKLYVIRKRVERLVRESGLRDSESLLRAEPLEPHHQLQGPAAARSDPAVLQGPDRPRLHERARPRPPALQHQHVPVVGPRPSLPVRRAQRRDQHAPRQRQLDARPRVDVRLAALRRGHGEALPDHRAGRQRLGRCSTTRSSCWSTPAGRSRTPS
mgnify:CR=1 FL=1